MKLSFYYENSRKKRNKETWLLLASWSILVASYLLTSSGWREVRLPTGQAIPSFSLIHYYTKIPGPTCGLTRSFVNMAHLQLGDAFRAHFLGPFLFSAVLGASLYYSYRFFGGRRKFEVQWSKTGLKTAYVSGILLFLGTWIAKIVLGFY